MINLFDSKDYHWLYSWDSLESKSNQQKDTDKFNRVDMLVRDSKGELVIIEIQNENEYDLSPDGLWDF